MFNQYNLNKSYKLRDFNMKEDIHISEKHIPLIDKNYEKTLLGGILLDNSKFNDILRIVRGCHFEEQRHRDIFRAMERLYNKKEPIDTLSILEELDVQGDEEYEKYIFNLAYRALDEAIPHLITIANVVYMNSHTNLEVQHRIERLRNE